MAPFANDPSTRDSEALSLPIASSIPRISLWILTTQPGSCGADVAGPGKGGTTSIGGGGGSADGTGSAGGGAPESAPGMPGGGGRPTVGRGQRIRAGAPYPPRATAPAAKAKKTPMPTDAEAPGTAENALLNHRAPMSPVRPDATRAAPPTGCRKATIVPMMARITPTTRKIIESPSPGDASKAGPSRLRGSNTWKAAPR